MRIARIAGRYLIFDSDAAALLRRQVNTNGVLVGTAPQQPTQNMFLGLPIELRPEEVEALVRKGVAYVVDGASAHRDTLQAYRDPAKRQAYIESLRKQKEIAQAALAERSAQRSLDVADKIKRGKKQKRVANNAGLVPADLPEDQKTQEEQVGDAMAQSQVKRIAVTLTASTTLLPNRVHVEHRRADALSEDEAAPLCRHLLNNGFHMTPGLRFGAQYSVYPGDPLRFHAHFMASQYDWHEPIPILDIVAGGRLATAVKKAYLIGGEQPPLADSDPEPRVRTFCLEWAAM